MKAKKGKTCLVLSGGGTKGVYHVGVWKALREMEISVDAFVGNSIGAIVAGFLAQGEDEKLEEIGKNLSLDYLLNIPGEFLEEGEIHIGKAGLPAFQQFARDVVAAGGLDTAPMNALLAAHLSEERIRASGKDLGVVTFNLSDLKPREVFIDDMAPGTVLDYLMASSAFPGFVSREIAGDQYIDGGVYDNIPFEMARRRGYRRVIIVDISGLGRNRRPDLMEGETVYIRNSIKMGGVLDFDRRFLEDFMHLGYLDAMRSFGQLKGYNYFVRAGETEESAFASRLEGTAGKKKLQAYISPKRGDSGDTEAISMRSLFPEKMKYERNLLLVLLDCAATLLSLPRIREYTYAELAQAVLRARRDSDRQIEAVLKAENGNERNNKLKKFELVVRDAIRNRKFSEPIYYYVAIIEKVVPEAIGKILLAGLAELCPELPAGRLALHLGKMLEP